MAFWSNHVSGRGFSGSEEERQHAYRTAIALALNGQLGRYIPPLAPGTVQPVPGADFRAPMPPGANGGQTPVPAFMANPVLGVLPPFGPNAVPGLGPQNLPPVPDPFANRLPPGAPGSFAAADTRPEEQEQVPAPEFKLNRDSLPARDFLPPLDPARDAAAAALRGWPIETCRAVPSAGGKIDVVCTAGGDIYPLDALVVRAWRERRTRKYPLFDPDPNKKNQWSEDRLRFGGPSELFIKFDDWNDIHDVGEVFASDRPGLELLKPGRMRRCPDGREPNNPPEGAYRDRETMGHTHHHKVEPTVGPDDGRPAKLAKSGMTYMISNAGAFRINRDPQGIYSVTLLAGSWGRTSKRENGKRVAKEKIKQWTANDGLSKTSAKKKGKSGDPYKECEDVYPDYEKRIYRRRPTGGRAQ